jgi:hypothetical protein
MEPVTRPDSNHTTLVLRVGIMGATTGAGHTLHFGRSAEDVTRPYKINIVFCILHPVRTTGTQRGRCALQSIPLIARLPIGLYDVYPVLVNILLIM